MELSLLPGSVNGTVAPRMVYGAIIVGIVMIVVGAWLLYSQYQIVKTWPQIEATVTKSSIVQSRRIHGGVRYEVMLSFHYDRGQSSYTQDLGVYSKNATQAQLEVDRNPPGTPCLIRCSPTNPLQISYGAGMDFQTFAGPVILMTIGLVFVLVGIWGHAAASPHLLYR
jgi:hypothetical protein